MADRQLVRESIEIDAPIEVVWDALTDPATFVEGIDWVYEARRLDDGPMRTGSVYVERAKPGMRESTYRWEITACEPPHRVVHWHRSRELEAELEVLFEPINNGRTRYTQVMRFRALPAFRPLGFILERTVMKARMRNDFREMILPNYKRIAERDLAHT